MRTVSNLVQSFNNQINNIVCKLYSIGNEEKKIIGNIQIVVFIKIFNKTLKVFNFVKNINNTILIFFTKYVIFN